MSADMHDGRIFERGARCVLHVTDNFAPATGGLERAVAALCGRWVDLGVRPVVVTGWRPGLARREVLGGVEVVRVDTLARAFPGLSRDPDRVFFPPLFDPVATAQVADLVGRIRPDVVHGHGWMFDAVSRAFRGLPQVSAWHDFSAVCARKSMVRNGLLPCQGPRVMSCLSCASGQYGPFRAAVVVPAVAAARVLRDGRAARPEERTRQIAVSGRVRDAMVGTGSTAPAPRLVRTFIPDELIRSAAVAPRPDFMPEGVPSLVYAGQLAAHKGVPQLLAAHRALLASGVDVALVLLGLPTPGFDLDVHVAKEQSHRVVRRLRVDSAQVLGAFRHGDVGVAPSLQEPLGQVAVEMLAAGCPPVVSAGTGLAEVVEDEVSGLLVPPGDVEALTGAIARLIADESLRRSLGARGPGRAGMFTLSAVLPELLRVYDEVLGEPFLAANAELQPPECLVEQARPT